MKGSSLESPEEYYAECHPVADGRCPRDLQRQFPLSPSPVTDASTSPQAGRRDIRAGSRRTLAAPPRNVQSVPATRSGWVVFLIGVELQSNSSEQLAFVIPMTGGKYYNVRRTTDLEQAVTDINEVEKGVFYAVADRE